MPLGLSYIEKAETMKQLDRLERAALTKQIDASEEWEQPTPFDNVTVPSFPIECLPPQLKDYVLAVSEATQTPVDMAAVASLAVMGVCAQGKYKIQGKPDWIEPLNLYSVIVANPAERKSAVLNHLTKYIHEYVCLDNENRKPEIIKSRQAKKLLAKQLEALEAKYVKGNATGKEVHEKRLELENFQEIKELRLLADDASPEALTSLLADNNGKMAVISSEGGIFEILQGRYSSNVNIDTFLKAHCGDAIMVDRKGRTSEYIKEPCLTVLLSIQPQVLEGLISNEIFRGRGLTARFLYCLPESKIGYRKYDTQTITEEIKLGYKDFCFTLLDLSKDGSVEILTLSDEAKALSAEFAKELEPRLIDDLDSMSDFAGKLHGAVLRIAGILHVINQLVFAESTPLPKETMQAAIQIGYYFLEHARVAYRLMGTDERMQDAKYILGKIKKQRLAQVTKRDLVRLCRKYKTTEQLTEPLNFLVQSNYLREQPQTYNGTGRQPEVIYIINPLWLNQCDKCD